MPVLQRLNAENQQRPALPDGGKARKILALVLTPTRELALQIFDSFRAYGRFCGCAAVVVFGGVNQNNQVQALKRGVDILVATPGRLNDLIGQGFIQLDQVEIFVLDEADRMLDMGFINDVKKSNCPDTAGKADAALFRDDSAGDSGNCRPRAACRQGRDRGYALSDNG